MKRAKKGMALSGVVMILSAILMTIEAHSNDRFALENMVSHLGLFMVGVFCFIVHFRKFKKSTIRNQQDKKSTLLR